MKKIRTIFVLLAILIGNYIYAQSIKTSTLIYEQYENNKIVNDKIIKVICDKSNASIENSSTNERFFINYKKQTITKTGVIGEKKYAVVTPFKSLSQPTIVENTDTILGYICKKAIYDVFSNKIEVWFTNKLNYKGCPSISFAPIDGLVLKYIVNGNRLVLAKSISFSDEAVNQPGIDFIKVNEATYLAEQIKSRYIRIPIFEKEQINFENNIINSDNEKINHTYRYSKGNIILKKIKLPNNGDKGLYFVQLTDWSNGDAYDRVGSVFTFSVKNEETILNAFQNGIGKLPLYIDNQGNNYQGIIANENYSPVIELMRFFTPFGVGYFNSKRVVSGYHWSDSAVYKQEVTSLIPDNEKEIWIGVYIGNYDKGGHKVSLELDFYPEPEMGSNNKWIQPLFNTVNIMEADGQNYGKLFQNDSLEMQFEITDSLQNLNLLFTTTGHGGWENGDEFVPKLNQIFIDDLLVFQHTPWRTDCGTYRLLNPASGNFPDGLSSSDLSRSNWCPGTLTPPYIIPLTNIAKGKHNLRVVINQGKSESGSFSHWCVSGVLTGSKK